MTYEAGFCVFAFVAFCAVVVYALYRRALVVEGEAYDEVLLSRDDVLELAKPISHDLPDFPGEQPKRPIKVSLKWQPHDTDKMPVDYWNDVRVMFRDGTISDTHQACHLRWWPLDEESDADIMAYRIDWPC